MSKREKRQRNGYAEQPYVRRLNEMISRGDISLIPGSLHRLTVVHDDWCELLKGQGGLCNCRPEFRIER